MIRERVPCAEEKEGRSACLKSDVVVAMLREYCRGVAWEIVTGDSVSITDWLTWVTLMPGQVDCRRRSGMETPITIPHARLTWAGPSSSHAARGCCAWQALEGGAPT